MIKDGPEDFHHDFSKNFPKECSIVCFSLPAYNLLSTANTRDFFLRFLEDFGVDFFGFPVVFEGPGGLKQLRGTRRIHFHHSWYLENLRVSSYLHFCEKGHDY